MPATRPWSHSLDESVGRVLARLDERGLADNTLVIFLSDNGGHVMPFDDRQVTDNSPLRSGKGSLYEGGVRVPLIIRWPGVTTAGDVCDEPVCVMDLLPTIGSIAGQPGEGKSWAVPDGISLVPLLNDSAATLDRDALYFHYPHYYPTTTPAGAIRSARLEAAGVFRGRPRRALQPSGRPGRNARPGHETARAHQAIARQVARLAPPDQRADADPSDRRMTGFKSCEFEKGVGEQELGNGRQVFRCLFLSWCVLLKRCRYQSGSGASGHARSPSPLAATTGLRLETQPLALIRSRRRVRPWLCKRASKPPTPYAVRTPMPLS